MAFYFSLHDPSKIVHFDLESHFALNNALDSLIHLTSVIYDQFAIATKHQIIKEMSNFRYDQYDEYSSDHEVTDKSEYVSENQLIKIQQYARLLRDRILIRQILKGCQAERSRVYALFIENHSSLPIELCKIIGSCMSSEAVVANQRCSNCMQLYQFSGRDPVYHQFVFHCVQKNEQCEPRYLWNCCNSCGKLFDMEEGTIPKTFEPKCEFCLYDEVNRILSNAFS